MAKMREMYCITSGHVYDLANELRWVCKNYNRAAKEKSKILQEQLYWEIAGYQRVLDALGIETTIAWNTDSTEGIEYFEIDLLPNDIFFID